MLTCKYCDEVHEVTGICMGKLKAEFPGMAKQISHVTSDEREVIELRSRVTRLKLQIEERKLFAQLWMARAVSGEYKNKVGHVTDGTGRQLTDTEILHSTLQTAEQHIHLIDEWMESLVKLEEALAIATR